MMGAKEEFLALSGRVQLKDGTVHRLHRGDEIPKKADPDSVERLRRIGAIGEPSAEPEAEEEGSQSVEDLVGVLYGDELREWAQSARVEQVVEFAQADPERASELLAIEGEGKGRSTLIAQLSEIAEQAAQAGDQTGDGSTAEGQGNDEATGQGESEGVGA